MNNTAVNFTRKSLGALAIGLSLTLSFTPPLLAQVSGRVTFARGRNMATLNGTIMGRQYRDFILRVKAGQIMSVSLEDDGTGNPIDRRSVNFNILPPGTYFFPNNL